MPWTLNTCHSSHFNATCPSQKQQNVKFLPDFFILQEPLIIATQNLCHWIWHTSNPTYMSLKSFQCISPCQNQQNVKFMPVYWTPPNTKWKKNINLNREKVFQKAWKSAQTGFSVCQSQCTMSVNFVWQNVDFYARLLKVFLTQNEKNINLNKEKVFQKAWGFCTDMVYGYSNGNALYQDFAAWASDFFSYELLITQTWQQGLAIGFWNMPVNPRMGFHSGAISMHFSQSKLTKCEPHFMPLVSKNFDFSGTTYHRDSKPMPLDMAHLKPYIHTTQAISMHFSLSKSRKCEIFACLLNSPNTKWKNLNLNRGKVFQKAWKSAQRGFWVC